MLKEFLIWFGGFIGSFISIVIKYKIKQTELKNINNYIFAFLLAFAIYGLYMFLILKGLMPEGIEKNPFSLFGISLFLGFAIDELAKSFYQILKR